TEAREGRPPAATSGVSRRAHRRAGYGTAVGGYGYDGYSSPTSCGYVPYGFSYVAPCGYYTSTYAAPYAYDPRPFAMFYLRRPFRRSRVAYPRASETELPHGPSTGKLVQIQILSPVNRAARRDRRSRTIRGRRGTSRRHDH